MRSHRGADEFCDFIQTLALRVHKLPQGRPDYQSIYIEAQRGLPSNLTPDELRQKYSRCIELTKQQSDKNADGYVFVVAQMVLSDRLVTLADVGGSRELVNLLETADVDGEASLLLSNAISRCGRHALLPLRRMKGDRAEIARDVIAAIEKGATYGP